MSSTEASLIVIPPPKYGTKKFEVRDIAAKALGKIMKSGQVDIVGLGEAVGIAGTVAKMTMAGKRIRIDHIYISKLSINHTDFEAIGIDLRMGKDDEGLFEGDAEKPFLRVSINMTKEEAISRGCATLDRYEDLWVTGTGSTLNKVVDVSLTLPTIYEEDIGVDNIKLGTVIESHPYPGRKHTSLSIHLSREAAGNTAISNEDYFKNLMKEIKKALKGAEVVM